MVETDIFEDADLLALFDLGFRRPRFFNPDHWAAVIPVGSFAAIVDGDRDSLSLGYKRQWNYQDHVAAVSAIEIWNGEDQPKGWVSHHVYEVVRVWP